MRIGGRRYNRVVPGRSNLIWTVVGVLAAIALIIFIVTHVSAH